MAFLKSRAITSEGDMVSNSRYRFMAFVCVAFYFVLNYYNSQLSHEVSVGLQKIGTNNETVGRMERDQLREKTERLLLVSRFNKGVSIVVVVTLIYVWYKQNQQQA